MWLRMFGTTLLGRLSHRLLWTKHAALPRTKPLLQLSKIAQWSGHLQQGRLSSHLGSGGCASIATPWRTAPRWSCRRSLATSVRDQRCVMGPFYARSGTKVSASMVTLVLLLTAVPRSKGQAECAGAVGECPHYTCPEATCQEERRHR